MDLFTQIGRLQIPTCKIAGENLLEGRSGLQTGSPLCGIHIHIHMLVSARVWRDKQIAMPGALRSRSFWLQDCSWAQLFRASRTHYNQRSLLANSPAWGVRLPGPRPFTTHALPLFVVGSSLFLSHFPLPPL